MNNINEIKEVVISKKNLPSPTKLFNKENGIKGRNKTVSTRLNNLLSIKELTHSEKLVVINMIEEIKDLDIPKISNPFTNFRNCLNGMEKINPKQLSSEIARMNNLFQELLNPTYEKLTFNKPTIGLFEMKKYIINKFSQFVINGFEEEKSITIISRLENSNDFTRIIYSYTKGKIFTGKELVDKVYTLIGDYKKVNSSNVTGLVGNKTEKTIQKGIYRTIEEDMDLNKSNRLVVTYGGSIGEVVNFYPLVYDKDYKLVINFFEKTPYQFHKDLMENTEELHLEVGKIETRYRKFTKNFTKKGKDIEFCKIIRKELNELEEQGIHNMDTSCRYMFMSNKIFGGNLSWKGGKTQGSFSKGKKIQKSTLSKIDFGKHILESFSNVEIRNESYEVIYEDYNETTDFHSNDPLYCLPNGLYIEDSTRTKYGVEEGDFNHKDNLERFMNLKSVNKIYHNYPNKGIYDLIEDSELNCVVVEKTIQNGREKTIGEEIILHTTTKDKSVINTDYIPQLETLLVS